MSLGIYPEFSAKIKGAKFKYLGEVLFSNIDALDEIAVELNLTPISSFGDNRPVPDDFEGPSEDLEELMGEWTEWFDAGEGQFAIQQLIEAIMERPALASRLDGAEEVVLELKGLASILSRAVAQSARFRLGVC
jgi:hypothetical protein